MLAYIQMPILKTNLCNQYWKTFGNCNFQITFYMWIHTYVCTAHVYTHKHTHLLLLYKESGKKNRWVIYKSCSEPVALSETKLTPNQHSAQKVKKALKEKESPDAAAVLQVLSASYPCQPANIGVKEFFCLNSAIHLATLKPAGLINSSRYNIWHNKVYSLSLQMLQLSACN